MTQPINTYTHLGKIDARMTSASDSFVAVLDQVIDALETELTHYRALRADAARSGTITTGGSKIQQAMRNAGPGLNDPHEAAINNAAEAVRAALAEGTRQAQAAEQEK